MRIYISGKITGLPIEEVKEKFKKASKEVASSGHWPVNPLEISPFEESKSWIDYMADDIKELLSCDAIYLLKDWNQSKGARIEFVIAKELGLIKMFEK